MDERTCSVEGCERPLYARGCCGRHYGRLLRHGDPVVLPPRKPRTRKPVEQRFWAKVNKNGPGGCWTWTGATTRGGYGNFTLADRNHRRAHRMAWELAHGPIPDGFLVCHRCDNPPCVRPDHLFLGTDRDNSIDCVSKGRHKPYRTTAHRGEGNPNAKLTAEKVREIRRAAADGEKLTAIAVRFGLSEGGVRHVVARERWAHVVCGEDL